MINVDNIVENHDIFLRNLNTNPLNTLTGTWSNGLTGYGFYPIPYEFPLAIDRIYYGRFTYKFTTTNQSPTWVAFFTQGGAASPVRVNNPVAGTEYTMSFCGSVVNNSVGDWKNGTLYNGDSSKIAGVTSYAKDVLVYDVTDLFHILKNKGTVTTEEALKTWCDTNLEHRPRYTNYDITALVNNDSVKIGLSKTAITAKKFIEPDGMIFFAANNECKDPYADNGLPFGVYNNTSAGNAVTMTRETDTESPFYPTHQKVVKITTNGTATPGAGGFYCRHTAKANGVFVERFVAKIPVGYTFSCAYNPQGTGSNVSYLTPREGTGKYEEYAVLYKCGSSGTFSTGGHVYISGTNNTSVTWYVAYCINCDVTDDPSLIGFTILGNKDSFSKEGYVFSREFNCRNIIANGTLGEQESVFLPSGWTFDDTDYAGNASCSVVQPVGAAAAYFGEKFEINPACRYKLSYWVKCKGDMTSFLTGVVYSVDNKEITHDTVHFISDTKTRLAAELKSGDTSMTVESNKNWITRDYSGVGFRTYNWKQTSYNDLGTFTNSQTGAVAGVTGTTVVNFKKAYTGATMPVGTEVVESYSGGTYIYPVSKSMLPTDNSWKYVEGYFGAANIRYTGEVATGHSSWEGIPVAVTHARLRINLYANTGSVPIKFSDIRVEVVDGGSGNRSLKKIQFSK